MFSWVISLWEVEKLSQFQDYTTGQELMEKIQILVLIVLYPSSDIMQASAWPLEPTGQDTENHLAQSVNESDERGHGAQSSSGSPRKAPLSG